MAYTKTEWKDRVVEKPLTYTIQDNGDGTVTLVPAPGTVVQAGTPVNATNMNKIEQGIADAALKADFDAKFHTTGHKHTGVAGQGPLLGVDSQAWSDIGAEVVWEYTPEKNHYGGGWNFVVVKPGRYRITGEFKMPGGWDDGKLLLSIPYLYVQYKAGGEFPKVITKDTTRITTSTVYTTFTIDTEIILAPCTIYLGTLSNESVYVRNVKVYSGSVANPRPAFGLE